MFDPDYSLFVAVAEAGSLSAAARRLRLSPAMVSKRLQRLEGRLGVTLVHRTTRRLVLTPAGLRFRDDLIDIAAALDTAETRVSGDRGRPSGMLRVTAPTSFGRLHVAPCLDRFLAANPAVQLRFDLSDRFVDLLGERIDCAIRIARDVPPNLVAHRLAGSGRILCAAPSYLAAHGAPRTIEDLAGHRLLAADGQMPWRLVCGSRSVDVVQDSHVASNSSELIREVATAGAGIALRSLWDVGEALRQGRLQRVLPDWQGATDVGIFAVHLPVARPSAAVAAFVAFLRDTLHADRWDADRWQAVP